MNKPEKIAFCTTCMNRLNHLEKTLEKNIQDNYLPENVEFVLLDYNSKDGLDQWIQYTMQQYIEAGILVYYKTLEPTHYLRSHSRNMAFRLAEAGILCNLDADNFLGKGFAAFMLQEFSKYNDIFYTNNNSCNDTFGRICMRKKDFMAIRGYNEALTGYGYEDMDVTNRLKNRGLNQMRFNNPEFYRFVLHSDTDRISEEYMAKNVIILYITYINPYSSGILMFYRNYVMEQYTLVDTLYLNVCAGFSSDNDLSPDERYRTTISGSFITGTWSEDNDKIYIQENNTKHEIRKELTMIDFRNQTYYKVEDDELKVKLFTLLSGAINFNEAKKQMKDNSVINPEGFGKGSVFKNFDLSKQIILP